MGSLGLGSLGGIFGFEVFGIGIFGFGIFGLWIFGLGIFGFGIFRFGIFGSAIFVFGIIRRTAPNCNSGNHARAVGGTQKPWGEPLGPANPMAFF